MNVTRLHLLQSVCVSLCLQTGLGGGSLLSLSDAVSQAARTAGVKPITSAEQLQDDLETHELKEAYAEQVTQFCNRANQELTTHHLGEFNCSLVLLFSQLWP